jgi:tetratricopeptide (TPR) repeat protein
LGDVDLAIHDLTLLIMLDPTLPDRNRLILKIADLYVAQNRWPDAAKIYFNFFQSPPPNATFKDLMFCRLQYGRALMQLGQSQRVRQHWQETITWAKTQKAAGIDVYAGADAYAQVLFLWSEADFQDYMALQMQGPSEALQIKQLQAKTKALDALEKQSIEILETNSEEWGMAALLRLGLAYENMSDCHS